MEQGEEGEEDYFNKKKRRYKTVNENIQTYFAGVLLRNNKTRTQTAQADVFQSHAN
jgi:hypothetical protein